MRIRPGHLNRRLSVDVPAASSGGDYGREPGGSMESAGSVMARIRHTGGREFYEAQRNNAEISAEIVIRYRELLDSQACFKRAGVVYEAVSPPMTVFDQKRYLVFYCKVTQ